MHRTTDSSYYLLKQKSDGLASKAMDWNVGIDVLTYQAMDWNVEILIPASPQLCHRFSV